MIIQMIVVIAICQPTFQYCPEEVTLEGTVWHQTSSSTTSYVKSDPLCYYNDTLVTRNCSNSTWTPPLSEIGPCLSSSNSGLSFCPSGYSKISNNYCYQIEETSTWNFPCFKSGAASVVTDLSNTEIEHLLNSLVLVNSSRYFWLPAQRKKLFHPVVWSIPGPHWGQSVSQSNLLHQQTLITKHCLLLDIEKRTLLTDYCSKQYPSLCIYVNNLYISVQCPAEYHSLSFKSSNNTCYGIVKSDTGLSYDDFRKKKCANPMDDDNYNLTEFIFKKIAEINELSDDVWCWFKKSNNIPLNQYNDSQHISDVLDNSVSSSLIPFQGIINRAGTRAVLLSNASLSCMACELEMVYGDTQFMFEYNDIVNEIYVTVYYPSGLWKYKDDDKGFQCFSDAKGFVTVVDVDEIPLIEIRSEINNVEKIVYGINLLTDSSGQYWCEGHTVNFSLISTEKLIVNPKGNKLHVFSLVIEYSIVGDSYDIDSLSSTKDFIETIFGADTVLLMDVFEYILDHIMVLLHLHVTIEDIYDNEASNIKNTYNNLKIKAELELPKYNFTLVNISSSLYCLATTSKDVIKLDWEMTAIGHITAPLQFCLQSNGLPVKRNCYGSYMFGSIWGNVEGQCDTTYKPSETTTFLYNFVKEEIPENNISQFLTKGLGFVLDDPDIIIPADIYYLSISLQKIQTLAVENVTSVDMGDIDNIAWIMDRVMLLDCTYLSLAQTLNSTNVILDSVTDIIEIIAQNSFNATAEIEFVSYQLAVQPQFIVQISYPTFNNITGIAIIKESDSDHFIDMKIQPLFKNTTLEEVLAIKNLEIATWLPTNILETIRINTNNTDDDYYNENLHIIITIFYNNAMFQELSETNHTINSRIIGIYIPEYISNLKYPVPLLFKQINHTGDSFCGYWEFQSQSVISIPGSWKNRGCFLVNSLNGITICECYHLTHFGNLVYNPKQTYDEMKPINETHTTILNVITLVGSFLSLLGIIGIWITALVFRTWRKKAGTKILLPLSTAVALPLIFIVVFNLCTSIFVLVEGKYVIADDMKGTCIVLGAMLHFSILASFMWMLITAVLQFIRYVKVLGALRPARFMFKFNIIGWGIPLIPVITTLWLDAFNYIPGPSTTRRICYPTGIYLMLAVLLPICLILLTNIILFILVLKAISIRSDKKMKISDIDLVWAQLRVSIFLFFLLGLTWIFAIISFSKQLIWSYLFCLTSTVQGFVLFLYFVICDPSTRNLWITLMKPQFTTNSSRNSITSITG